MLPNLEPVNIKIIEAVGFLVNYKYNYHFQISYKEVYKLLEQYERNLGFNKLTVNNMNASDDIVPPEELARLVFLEQQKQLKVFNKRKITELPPYKEYDYKIKFKEDINVELAIRRYLFYFISPFKLRKVKEYLEENF